MSSIDGEPDSTLDTLFEVEFGSTGRSLSEQGIRFIVPSPDPLCGTYFIQRRKRCMERADFELNLGDLEKVKHSLQELWTGPESPHLTRLSEKVLALAPRYTSVESDAEVSSLIYVMF